jgi:MarR family
MAAVASPVFKVVRINTGDLSNPQVAAAARDQELPPTAGPSPSTVVIDLAGKLLSPPALRELIVTVGQRVRGGVYGDMKVIVATSHPATREAIHLLAREHDFPVFLAHSIELTEIHRAEPAGDLTATERDTLETLRRLGGQGTIAGLAGYIGIEPTAATNRLVNLERKGYVYRFRRPRQHGDLFADPRVPLQSEIFGSEVPPPRDALLAHGIRIDPYDVARIELQGEAARRAADIVERRRDTP